MARNTNIRRIYAGAFLILFLAFYINATAFRHCHIINGVTIVHSHIHANSHHSVPNGEHSSTSITLIAMFDGAAYTDAVGEMFDFSSYAASIGVPAPAVFCADYTTSLSASLLRAPPSL